MLSHLHVKNLALIEEIEVEFGPGLNILTGETGAGKSILLGSMQLILGAKTSKNMIRENASYALVELLFQVENEKALETLKALDICPEDGQVLLSRKIMDGRSINKINGETSTVGQMKAAAACLLDIHGQHEHQSLLYQDKQLAILDAYGKEKILPAKEKVSLAYKEYSKCKTELGSMNMNEEQRNRELAFLEFEIKEIEKANLQPGEDEELEARYRKMSNAKLIVDSLQLVHNLTGYESKEGAGETVGEALKEFSHVTQYDPELTPLAETLTSVDGLLNDFNRELSAYLDELTFDEGEFYETERRLDLINGLKAKYGRTIEEIFTYRKLQEEKLEKLHKYEENLQELKEHLRELENILEKTKQRADITYSEFQEIRATRGLMRLQQGLRNNRSYAVPIQTADGVTQMNLTFREDEEQAGKVQVTIWQPYRISMEMQISGGSLKGLVLCDDRAGYEKLKQQAGALQETLEQNVCPVKTISYGMDFRAQNDYSAAPENDNAVDTKALYQTAKVLVQYISEVVATENGGLQ